MKEMGRDDQMRGTQTIDQIDVLAGDGDRMIRLKVLQTIDQVHLLPGDEWKGIA